MEFDDFCTIFDCIQVCHKTMPAPRAHFQDDVSEIKLKIPKVEEPDYDTLLGLGNRTMLGTMDVE